MIGVLLSRLVAARSRSSRPRQLPATAADIEDAIWEAAARALMRDTERKLKRKRTDYTRQPGRPSGPATQIFAFFGERSPVAGHFAAAFARPKRISAGRDEI